MIRRQGERIPFDAITINWTKDDSAAFRYELRQVKAIATRFNMPILDVLDMMDKKGTPRQVAQYLLNKEKALKMA